MAFKMNKAPFPTTQKRENESVTKNKKGKINKESETNKSSTFQKNAPTKMGGMLGLMGGSGGNPTMGTPAHNSSGSKSLQDDYIANKNSKPSGVKNYKKGYKTPGA
jgi:hypothetical protein